MIRKQALLALALTALATGVPSARAADAYPNKPITLIIGFAPGGPTDAIGRVLFKRVSEELKVPIVIENRPGAGGNIGTQELVRAKPDGYTLLYGTSSLTTAPALFNRADLDPTKAFEVASCSVAVPLILLASKKNPADSPQALYQAMKADPSRFFLGSSGNGSVDHLVAMDVAGKLGLTFQHVPYKGNGPALTDLAAGNVNFMYSGSFNSAMPFIQNGQVKALAVTSERRSSALPNVPSLSESIPQLKGFDAGTAQVLAAPNGTPPAILARLDQAIQAAIKDPKVKESLDFQGAEPMNLNPAQCKAHIAQEFQRWTGTIQRLGLKAE
ncbi:Bug family tripartite tricarboxylate transporter substrate binding protein [Bordetella genomosp. 13]|uniref:Bug family tripartite tricarboxylate transporter substrate binding protein n=1 Tax=Bordetella genomosp. 13 TaxID=463040 RepID=UPI001642FBA6|nr:tripartite tricarboxylate transporter substrate binding protein [Bordetella genomosp. 13]